MAASEGGCKEGPHIGTGILSDGDADGEELRGVGFEPELVEATTETRRANSMSPSSGPRSLL